MPTQRLTDKAVLARKAAQPKQTASAATGKSDRSGSQPAADLLQRAAANPGSLAPADLLVLQRAGGNRAVGRLLAPNSAQRPGGPAVQFKLAVGPAGDQYEQEADRMAEQVMKMPAPQAAGERPPVQRVPDEDEPDVQAKPLARRITPLTQRALAEGAGRILL